MEIIKVLAPASHTVALTGCKHMGNQLRHTEAITELYDEIAATRNMFMCDLGDTVEGICIDDKRFTLDNVDPSAPVPLLQAKAVIKEMAPVAKKTWIGLQGNHEQTLHKFGDIAGFIYGELGIRYGGYMSVVEVCNKKTGKLMYKMFLTHGRRGINSSLADPLSREASMQRTLRNQLYAQASDCLVMVKAHTHKLIVAMPHPELLISHPDGRIKQHYTGIGDGTSSNIRRDERIYINCGSFLRSRGTGFTSYAERAEYAPLEIGYATLTVQDGQVICAEKKVV